MIRHAPPSRPQRGEARRAGRDGDHRSAARYVGRRPPPPPCFPGRRKAVFLVRVNSLRVEIARSARRAVFRCAYRLREEERTRARRVVAQGSRRRDLRAARSPSGREGHKDVSPLSHLSFPLQLKPSNPLTSNPQTLNPLPLTSHLSLLTSPPLTSHPLTLSPLPPLPPLPLSSLITQRATARALRTVFRFKPEPPIRVNIGKLGVLFRTGTEV